MNTARHLDEARSQAVEVTRALLEEDARIAKAVLVDDLFGRIRLILWAEAEDSIMDITPEIASTLREKCGQFWTGDIYIANTGASPSDRAFHEAAWGAGRPVSESSKLRINDRYRNRAAWFAPPADPLWSGSEGSPLVAFHSFKGGVGRTTALASYAIQRARRGDHVAVVDMDLDAPGVGTLLDAGEGESAQWGVVDFMLESKNNVALNDYHHRCTRLEVTHGEGAISVFPAGRVDREYLSKLARVDLEISSSPVDHPFSRLLHRIRDELRPSVILIDSRAGLSPAAGLLLMGIAHAHVLFATTNEQSLRGLALVVERLGGEYARRNLVQADCIVVHAMVPDSAEIAALASTHFNMRVEDIFRDHYYAYVKDEKDDADDRLWTVRDLTDRDAPHIGSPLGYRGKLAFFRDIDQIADVLASEKEYADLAARIDSRLDRLKVEALQEP
ncbi:MinD/ParA family protein [Pendulispora albinea]|uniref:CobQ/CobB/MinD/ParA nucleotide binding domain-containing protein n=1 Tax=Pendulispora albinea TaxID=2741071 RepID=A0ABZ2LUE4_9BACT